MSRNGMEWTRKPELSPGLYVDPRIYTDPEIFAEEKPKIFDKSWLIACHESEIPEPLDYRAYQHPGGHNLIVLRGEDRVVRVFQNICPHRGNRLLYDVAGSIKGSSPSGAPDRITCIFHAWAFDSKGNCVDIPRRKAGYQDRLHECDVSLREVRCEVGYGGFVWVTMNDAAADLTTHLGGALDDLAPMLAEPMEIFHYHRAIVHGNYKMWHDTNSEFYHDYMHYHNRVTGMLKKEYWDREYVAYEGGHAKLTGMTLKYDAYEGQTQRTLAWPGMAPAGWELVDLFPGITYNIRAPAFRLDTSIPIGPNLLYVEFRGLGLKRDTPEERQIRIRDHNSIWGPFGRNLAEDLLGTTGQGTALNDSSEAPFVLHGRLENGKIHDEMGMRHFLEEWSRKMGRSSSDPFNRGVGLAAE